jgi:ribonuclease HII
MIKADLRCSSVAAASVLAKVERDGIMQALSPAFPAYSWADNKGYSAPEHVEALRRLGPTEHHRQTWRLPLMQRVDGPLDWDVTIDAGDDVLL